MNAWAEFGVAIAAIGLMLLLLWRGKDDAPAAQEWESALLVHVTYDGEIVEYPTLWDVTAEQIADWLASVEELPEAVEA